MQTTLFVPMSPATCCPWAALDWLTVAAWSLYSSAASRDPDQASCILCPLNTYSSHANRNVCTACPDGSITKARGATSVEECQSCPAGSGKSTTDPGKCVECAAGSYSSGAGCVPCGSGKWSSGIGSTSCTSCAASKRRQWATDCHGKSRH